MPENIPLLLRVHGRTTTLYGVLNKPTGAVVARMTQQGAEQVLINWPNGEFLYTVERLNTAGWDVLPLTRID